MTNEKILEMLEEIPLGLSRKLKVGENDYALSQLQKNDNPKWTMKDIKEHNIEARGWDEGFAAAMEEIKKWRNEKYLEIKNLA